MALKQTRYHIPITISSELRLIANGEHSMEQVNQIIEDLRNKKYDAIRILMEMVEQCRKHDCNLGEYDVRLGGAYEVKEDEHTVAALPDRGLH